MKVSVIMPAYNRAPYLKASIDSVLRQTYPDYELIVIDDESTDETAKIVLDYPFPHIHYFKVPHGGPSRARNFGIRKTSGEVIAFLDSDDLWEPESLACRMRVFEEHPEAGVVFSDYKRIDPQGKVLEESVLGARAAALERGTAVCDLLEDCPVTTNTALVRKALLKQAGLFDENLVWAEDYDLWLRLSQVCSFQFVARPLTRYRLHPDQLTRQSREKTWLGCAQVIRKHKKWLKTRGGQPQKLLAKFYGMAGNANLLRARRGRALIFFLKAAAASPADPSVYRGLLKCLLPARMLRKRYLDYCRRTKTLSSLVPYY